MGADGNADISGNPLRALCIFDWCIVRPLWLGLGLFNLFVATVFFFPTSILLYIHTKNFVLGKTSHERFSRKAANTL